MLLWKILYFITSSRNQRRWNRKRNWTTTPRARGRWTGATASPGCRWSRSRAEVQRSGSGRRRPRPWRWRPWNRSSGSRGRWLPRGCRSKKPWRMETVRLLFCSTSEPLASTRWVRLIFSRSAHFTLSSASTKSHWYKKLKRIFLEHLESNPGCWVRSKDAHSVLCSLTAPEIAFYIMKASNSKNFFGYKCRYLLFTGSITKFKQLYEEQLCYFWDWYRFETRYCLSAVSLTTLTTSICASSWGRLNLFGP